jgi:uncharacterized membrane protein
MANGVVTALYVALGLGFSALGIPLALRRVPPNSTYGFRMAKTLADPRVWYAANRAQGVDLCIAGVVIVVLSIGLYVVLRDQSPSRLALADVGMMVLVLGVVAAHGYLVLERL